MVSALKNCLDTHNVVIKENYYSIEIPVFWAGSAQIGYALTECHGQFALAQCTEDLK
jgi:hypothetical protein